MVHHFAGQLVSLLQAEKEGTSSHSFFLSLRSSFPLLRSFLLPSCAFFHFVLQISLFTAKLEKGSKRSKRTIVKLENFHTYDCPEPHGVPLLTRSLSRRALTFCFVSSLIAARRFAAATGFHAFFVAAPYFIASDADALQTEGSPSALASSEASAEGGIWDVEESGEDGAEREELGSAAAAAEVAMLVDRGPRLCIPRRDSFGNLQIKPRRVHCLRNGKRSAL